MKKKKYTIEELLNLLPLFKELHSEHGIGYEWYGAAEILEADGAESFLKWVNDHVHEKE